MGFHSKFHPITNISSSDRLIIRISNVEFGETIVAADVSDWMKFAVENHVQYLEIRPQGHLLVYSVPEFLELHSMLKKLGLVDCDLHSEGPTPAWDQLTSLEIAGYFDKSSINRVLSGTPNLEVFILWPIDNKDLIIDSTNLRRLEISIYQDQPSPHTWLKIWCPSLETLKLYGSTYDKYMLKDCSSLTNASLMFGGDRNVDYSMRDTKLLGEAFSRQILPAFRQVERLVLSHWSVRVLVKTSLLSPVRKLKFLTLNLYYDIHIRKLIGTFPDLEWICIQDARWIRNIQWPINPPPELDDLNYLGFPVHLKTIEVTSAFADELPFGYVELMIKHAKELEKLVIHSKWFRSSEGGSQEKHLRRVSQALMLMPRFCPTLEIIICSECHKHKH